MTTVIIGGTGTHRTVRFRYDPDLVGLIKTIVPSYGRSWRPHDKSWTVDIDWTAELIAAARAAGHTVITDVDGAENAQHQHPHSDRGPGWANGLFDRVGSSRAPACYKALSRVLHPDAGGDTALQQELNRAFAELEGGR
jgi:hypothetical protein